MHPTRLFPAMCQVLDEADARQSARDGERAMLGREELLGAVRQLSTSHDPDILIQAVDACMNPTPGVTEHRVSVRDQVAVDFDFGWQRPATPAQWDAQQAKVKQRRWFTGGWVHDVVFFSVGILLFMTSAALALLVTVWAGSWLGEWVGKLFLGGPLRVSVFNFFGSLGAVVALFYACITLPEFFEKRALAKPATTSSSPEMSQWITGDLQRPDDEYLRYPSTRAYLRAVLDSALPRMMWGDSRQIEALYERAMKMTQIQENGRAAQEKQRAKEEAKRQTELARRNRMTNFEQRLNNYRD